MKMTRKRAFLFGGLAIIAFVIYWVYFPAPGTFPSHHILLNELNKIYPEIAADVIQDHIYVDEKHVIVPFISENDSYGLSYWVWTNHSWKNAYIDTKGGPKIWRISTEDPDDHYLIYNIHPGDQLDRIRFFMIRDRQYQLTEGNEYYSPRIQMEEEVSIKQKSYGIIKLPKEWVTYLESMIQVESLKPTYNLFNAYNPLQHTYIGWIPYDKKGTVIFPALSVNSNGYGIKEIDLEDIRLLNEIEIE